MSQNNNKKNLRTFFIKLVAIVFAAVIVLNVSYNLIISGTIESLKNKENVKKIENKIRSEIKSSLDKDKILNKEDKELLNKFYIKLKNEFQSIE